MKPRIFLGVLALALAGCVVGPDFERPALPTATPPPLENPPSMPEWVAWWRVFDWPDLDATVALALQSNRDLVAAQARFDESLARAGVIKGQLGPQVGLEGGTGRQKYGTQFLGPQDVPAFHYWSITATASWFVDYLGGERRAVERELAWADYHRHQFDAVYLSVTGNIVIQAIASASARAQIEGINGMIERDEKLKALAEIAYEAGDVPRMAVLDAQTQLDRDKIMLAPVQQEFAAASHALAVLIGRPAADWTPPAFDYRELPHPPVATVVPSEAVRNRPDLLAAEAQFHAATAAVGIATADLYPRIKLSASFGPQSNSLGDLLDEDNLASSLIAGIAAPIFDGGALQARHEAARAAMRITLAQYEQAVLQSFAQVSDLLDALKNDQAVIDAQIEAGIPTQARIDLAQESHAKGNAGIAPILEAERASLLSHVNHWRAIGVRRADEARLYLALGGVMPAP